jgi:hypothetical protein
MFKCKKGRKDERSPCRKLRKTECSGGTTQSCGFFAKFWAEIPQNNSMVPWDYSAKKSWKIPDYVTNTKLTVNAEVN